MKNMRSSLPIFIFIGLALFAIIGIIILQESATSASIEVNNTTTEELAVGLYGFEYAVIFGISALLLIVAAYIALKKLT